MGNTDFVTMSTKELDRLGVVERVLHRGLTQKIAGEMLGLSVRQVQRLCGQFEEWGPAGLVSRQRGRPSNRRLSAEFRAEVLRLVGEKYWDFGPTLAREKLLEVHGLRVGRETLRRWMVADEIWVTRREQKRRPYQPRNRRSCFGELVQIDGSPHAWFEDRGPECSLLVFIDDATGRLMELRFVESETTFDYFEATRTYLERHGKPVAFYSDKHSIFRVSKRGANDDEDRITQYGRALDELNIDIICANTPQAKGRVERANRTLQDRLVKELRLQGISNMDASNEFLPEFMDDFNARFARVPRSDHNAHRSLLDNEDLDQIFTLQEQRDLGKNLVVHYDNKRYVVEDTKANREFAGRRCEVFEWIDGRVEIRCDGVALPYKVLDKNPLVRQADIVENKRLAAVLEVIKTQQAERDKKRLSSKTLTKRQKKRISDAIAASQ